MFCDVEHRKKLRKQTNFLQDVVDRFKSQGETQQHLEELKKENIKQLQRLQEEKTKLQQEYEEMKYSGEAKLSR